MDLPIAKILKPNVQQILNRWLEINDQDKFTGRIYFTVREMYTVVRNSIAEVPTSHDSFVKGKPIAKAPRFDMMITRLKEDQRQMNASQTRFVDTKARDNRIKSYFETVDNKIGGRHMTPNKYSTIKYEGPPMIDTK